VIGGLSCSLDVYTAESCRVNRNFRGKMTAFGQAYKGLIQDLTGNRVPGTEIQWKPHSVLWMQD
jgi:hypothetical protein